MNIEDFGFKVKMIASPVEPNAICWVAMHQDYYHGMSSEDVPNQTEGWFGQKIVEKLLEGNRGHWGCLEHSGAFTFNIKVNHHTLMQMRTHRIAVSFDVQSFRYTGKFLKDITFADFHEFFYIPPVGEYVDRAGTRGQMTPWLVKEWKNMLWQNICMYNGLVHDEGIPEETARGVLPEYYQHAVVTFDNIRSLLHMADLRLKKDAQREIRVIMEEIFTQASAVMPEVCEYYAKTRLGKALLSP